MATRQQAERELAKLNLELDPDNSGKMPLGGFCVVIDAKGNFSFNGECRGHVVMDYTAPASQFWQEVINEGRELAPLLKPCLDSDCDLHGEPLEILLDKAEQRYNSQ